MTAPLEPDERIAAGDDLDTVAFTFLHRRMEQTFTIPRRDALRLFADLGNLLGFHDPDEIASPVAPDPTPPISPAAAEVSP